MPLHSSPLLIDTHCHLDFQDFESDRLAVVDAAKQAGVTALINPAVDVISSQSVVAQAHAFQHVYAAVGVHPNDALSWDDQTISTLEALAKDEKVVAIGEIGLDYYRDRTPRFVQIQVFKQQLELASKLGLPVILHNREASRDMLELLSLWISGLMANESPLAARPGVLHSFSGDESTAQQVLAMNFFIGITGPVTYRNATNLQRLVSQLPLDRILIETDAPFLTPQPRRGKRNEPAFVRYIAEKIAELHQRSFAEVAQITTTNARLLFQIGEKSLA